MKVSVCVPTYNSPMTLERLLKSVFEQTFTDFEVIISDYSSTHRQSVERQRVLIDSGHLAAEYRSAYVQAHFPRVMNLERLKYMRWVSTPMGAVKAQMTQKEYKSVLKRFEALGVWPLSYEWVGTIYYWASFKYKLKWKIKTFLTNHPSLSYMIIKLRKR